MTRVAVTIGVLATLGCFSSQNPADTPGGGGGDTGGTVPDDPADDTGGTGDDTGAGPLPCSERPARVEVGTGENIFESLVEAEPVVMVHGPQGGWHMLGSVRTHNMHNIIEVHYTVTDVSSGVVVSDNNYRVAVVEDEECSGYYPGMYGYLDVADLATEFATRPPEVLGYKLVDMKMSVTDYDGRVVTQTLRVTAQPDPVDIPGTDGDTGTP